jgi:integrase
MLGLLGLRIFEATSADIADLGEEHGHRILRVCGKGTKVVLVPLPPAVGRAIDRAIGLMAPAKGLVTVTCPACAACGCRLTMIQWPPARSRG